MSQHERHYSPSDRMLMRVGDGLGALFGAKAPAKAAPPAEPLAEPVRREAANLMRVNHAGEVAAQGLYHGQALTARNDDTRRHLLAAAAEEQSHLEWCEQRLSELGDGPSRLRPLWYGASFAMGAAAGLFGDRWSLGFVAETERQVSEHLDEHLQRLPAQDQKSREVLKAMRHDEQRHGREAEDRGGAPLPEPVRGLMRQVAKVMKEGAYRF
ncbi:MAG: 2-polyprenyl-3-methyl-6-methoxy-1,4-benzoquinone monooxygenase [Panacagrimonas sp.]